MMGTEDVKKSASTIKELLNNQYGGVGAAAALLWVLGNLAPNQFDQAVTLIGYLNTNVTFAVILFFILVYVNKTFFRAYLEKEKSYAVAVKGFENTLTTSLTKCFDVSQGVQVERRKLAENMENIDKNVVQVLNNVNLTIIPQLNQVLSFYEGDKGTIKG